jgi:hypothetical protein
LEPANNVISALDIIIMVPHISNKWYDYARKASP